MFPRPLCDNYIASTRYAQWRLIHTCESSTHIVSFCRELRRIIRIRLDSIIGVIVHVVRLLDDAEFLFERSSLRFCNDDLRIFERSDILPEVRLDSFARCFVFRIEIYFYLYPHGCFSIMSKVYRRCSVPMGFLHSWQAILSPGSGLSRWMIWRTFICIPTYGVILYCHAFAPQ